MPRAQGKPSDVDPQGGRFTFRSKQEEQALITGLAERTDSGSRLQEVPEKTAHKGRQGGRATARGARKAAIKSRRRGTTPPNLASAVESRSTCFKPEIVSGANAGAGDARRKKSAAEGQGRRLNLEYTSIVATIPTAFVATGACGVGQVRSGAGRSDCRWWPVAGPAYVGVGQISMEGKTQL